MKIKQGNTMVASGKPIGDKNLVKIKSLKNLIYKLLLSESMTTAELVACLMSEPYSIPPQDLHLITLALNNLSEFADCLKVSFRTNQGDLSVDPRFRTISNPTRY